MSIHGLENAIFDIASGPAETERYKLEPDAYLARYPPDAAEAHLVNGLVS